MNHLKKGLVSTLLAGALLAGCGAKGEAVKPTTVDLNALTMEEIEIKAKEEGEIQSVGMPDTWANWGETWTALEEKYSLTQMDTDMSSAEEIALFEAEKENATKDIGDVGQSFGPIAEDKGVTLPYKTSYWEDIPA